MSEVARVQHWDDKWPRLVVVGEKIDPRLAECILIRTMYPSIHCNDRAWEKDASEIIGLRDPFKRIEDSRRKEPGYLSKLFEEEDAAREAMGILSLHYLHNQRIASSWIGGTHGWCDWDGRIGCANYNIGKWPNTGEVTEDWTAIAQAFPFLDLHCQVVSLGYSDGYQDETPLDQGQVWGTWMVKDGKVTFDEDETTLLPIPAAEKRTVTPDDFAGTVLTGGHRLTLEALATIVQRVKSTLPSAGERKAISG